MSDSDLSGTPCDERWLPVVGDEATHEVSSAGRVRAGGVLCDLSTEKRTGYQYLTIRSRVRRVHRLVLEAFRGACPDGMESLHKNGQASDNRLDNLRWGTHAENCADLVRHGTHHHARKTECKRRHQLEGPNIVPAAARAGRRFCYACMKAAKTTFVRAATSPAEWEERMQVESDRQYARLLANAGKGWERQDSDTCKRGHRLVSPNLVLAALRRGARSCLACKRAWSSWNWFASKNPGHDRERWLQERADANYSRIMMDAA